MRKILSDKMEAGRIRDGYYASTKDIGPNGAFRVMGPCGCELVVIASDGTVGGALSGWEHVSVSTSRRTPNWQEMSWIKNQFWDDEETVMQLHPPRSSYIDNHPHCLHLWRPLEMTIPLPPEILVGVKELGVL